MKTDFVHPGRTIVPSGISNILKTCKIVIEITKTFVYNITNMAYATNGGQKPSRKEIQTYVHS